MLCRSIDLARMYRKISFCQGKPYIFMQRKGWSTPRWEEVVTLPTCPQLCPWELLKLYVRMTCTYCHGGSPIFRTLNAPFKPICANTIAGITKRLMAKLGIQVEFFKPHSTRGAGVTLYKKLGLKSEEVCEIGKWKNVQAFQSHYLRLGACQSATRALETFVHRASPGDCAEPDWTRTPRRKPDAGGIVQEGGAQDNGEARFDLSRHVHCFLWWSGGFASLIAFLSRRFGGS